MLPLLWNIGYRLQELNFVPPESIYWSMEWGGAELVGWFWNLKDN